MNFFHIFIIGEGKGDLKFIKTLQPKRCNNEESPSQVSSQIWWASSFVAFLSSDGLHLIDFPSRSTQRIASKFYEEKLFDGSVAIFPFKLVELVMSTDENAVFFTALE